MKCSQGAVRLHPSSTDRSDLRQRATATTSTSDEHIGNRYIPGLISSSSHLCSTNGDHYTHFVHVLLIAVVCLFCCRNRFSAPVDLFGFIQIFRLNCSNWIKIDEVLSGKLSTLVGSPTQLFTGSPPDRLTAQRCLLLHAPCRRSFF